jgi:folate-dependent tRNA-U54 methylase TrmFO/GidA
MKSNFGLLPPLSTPIRNKGARYEAYAERALGALAAAMEQHGLAPVPGGSHSP